MKVERFSDELIEICSGIITMGSLFLCALCFALESFLMIGDAIQGFPVGTRTFLFGQCLLNISVTVDSNNLAFSTMLSKLYMWFQLVFNSSSVIAVLKHGVT